MAAPKSGKTAKKNIDLKQLQACAAIGCTLKEMAVIFDCSIDTLSDNFSEAIEKGREEGKSSARRLMWNQAKLGSNVALRYIVHNVLKERIEDKTDFTQNNYTNEIMVKLNTISSDVLMKLVKGSETKES